MPATSTHWNANRDRLYRAAAILLVGLFAATALFVTHDLQARGPDTLQYNDIARSLARGDGYQVGFVILHPELYDSVERIPEMHGLLRPWVIAGLYGAFGIETWVPSVPGVLYVALTALVAFGFAQTLFGPLAGLLACAMILGSRALWSWALFGVDDTGLAFYFLLSTWLFYLGLRDDEDRWFAAAGLVAGVALLEKLSGLILPGMFVATLVTLRPWSARVTLRRAALAVVPVVFALGFYLLRNHEAHGGWMFRFSPIEWQWKLHGHSRLTRLYMDAPPVSELFQQIGPGAVVGLILTELRRLWTEATAEYPIWLGLAALALCGARRNFVVIALWTLLGSTAFLCVLYHVEPRYLSMLIALLSVSAAGGLVRLIDGVGRGPWRAAARWVGVGAALVVVGTTVQLLTAGVVVPTGRAYFRASNPPTCAGALEYLGQNVPAGAPVLSSHPWLTRWFGEHPSVSIPGTSNRHIATVLDHYGMEWVLVGPGRPKRQLGKLQRLFVGPYGGTVMYEGGGCRVYRVATR